MKSPYDKTPIITSVDDEDIDLLGLLHSIWDHKWMILLLSAMVAAIVGLYVSSRPPIYQARATLFLDQDEMDVVSSIQDIYLQGYRGFEYMQSQFELLRSRAIAERVVRKLEMHKMEQFQPQPPPPAPWYHFDLSKLKPAGANPPLETPWVRPSDEDLIKNLSFAVAGGVQVQQLGESNLVALTYRDGDPALAAKIVNTYLEQYIESFLDARMDSTLKATEWLNLRLGELKSNLKASEERLQAFRDQERLVDIEGVTTLSAQDVSSLNTTYSASRQRRSELETTQRELERLGKASTAELLTIPALQNHPELARLKQSLVEAERQVNEFSQRYGAKHNKMIEARSQLDSANSALDSEVKSVIYSISRDYQLALSTEMSSKNQLDSTKSDLQDLNRKEFALKELEREVETNSQLYNIFLTRIKETGTEAGFEAPPGRIIDLSSGGTPVGFNLNQTVGIAFFITFIVASGLAVLYGILDNTIKTPVDVEEKLRFPLLGTLPIMPKSRGAGLEEYWKNTKSEFAESIRTIRTGVVLTSLDSPAKIIVVTSSIPSEGKSTVALNLATAFAQVEKTLIIGGDLRRPNLARRCELRAKHPGLSDYIAGSSPLNDCIASWGSGDTMVDVMPTGIIPSNPLELLSSNKFRETLELLKARYDRILIDSAPVAAVSDAMLLAAYADQIVFVLKSDSTSVALIKNSLGQITNNNDVPLAIVLNQFDPKKKTKYYSNYSYRYKSQYYQTSETHG
jgi:polysaccharide biosynthesis transport protein